MNATLYNLRAAIGKRIGNRWIQLLLALKTEHQFAELYGDFHLGESFDTEAIKGLAQESGKIYGAIVRFLVTLPVPPKDVLLPGENNAVKPVYANLLSLPRDCFITSGILADMDVQWNFEQNPPIQRSYDCIVSQSMLEHLIDPYKHVRDCTGLLNTGGHMILHTMMPGFNYHRYPVDCFRFYPDWFEEVAKRLALTVVDKYIHNSRITYLYRK